jgi:tagatose 1,6-diphosphate aldolase
VTLHQLQTASNRFTIAACDQRSSLAKLLGVDPQSHVGVEALVQTKKLFMAAFSPLCSSVLTDPEFGLPSVELKSSHAGLLLSLERSPYDKENPEDLPPMYPNWGVQEIAAHGAAVKVLMYYHPQSSMASKKRAWMGMIFGQCQGRGVPCILEPIVHPFERGSLSLFEAQLQTVKDFTHLCDVLKIEFPMSNDESFSAAKAAERCESITAYAKVPWILLSRGMSYERFLLALDVAMKHGAHGFAVGRAVWKEIGEFPTWEEKEKFVRTTSVDRMKRLVEIVHAL